MFKFAKGDRVRVINDKLADRGRIGTVVLVGMTAGDLTGYPYALDIDGDCLGVMAYEIEHTVTNDDAERLANNA